MSTTPSEDATYQSVFGITPTDVMQLVKTTSLADNMVAPATDAFKARGRKAAVTNDDVLEYIRSVEGEVAAHLSKLGDPGSVAYEKVAGLARTATLNGAAHYVVVAAHPAAAATNDATAHAGVLWTRYRALLDVLDEKVDEIVKDPVLGDPAAGYVTGPSVGHFRRPRYFSGLEM